jgi:O-antigen/teichoic acid export membrane protein
MMKGISLLMIPFVTRHLSTAEYGTLETLLIFADVSTIIIGFGLVEALNRYVGLSREGDNEAKGIVASCYSLALLVTVICMLALCIFANSIIALLPAKVTAWQLGLIAFPALLEGLIAIPLTLMRMQSLAKKFCFFNVIKALVQAAMVIILLEKGYGIDAVLLAGAISSFLLIICLFPYQWQQMGRTWYNELSTSQFWKKNAEIAAYGAPIVAGRLGLFAMTGLDRWLLADKVGVESLAVYAIAVKFSLILALLMQPFSLWWFPYRFTLLKEQSGEERCAHYAMLGTNLGLIIGCVMLLTVPQFMQLILPVAYHDAALVVMALLVINMIKNAGDLLNLGCFIKSSLCQMWVQWMCAVLAIIGYFLFIEDYGIWAAVCVLTGVNILRLVMLYFYSQRVLRLPYNHRSWLWVFLLGFGSVSLLYFVMPMLPIFSDTFTLLLEFSLGIAISIIFIIILIIYDVLPNPLHYWKKRQDLVTS